jgi:membrane-associated protease RseP (regulator of RpoE activity)
MGPRQGSGTSLPGAASHAGGDVEQAINARIRGSIVSTALWTTFTVVLSLAAIAAHEYGHTLALRRYGIPVAEAGIGLGFPPCLKLPPRGRRTFTLSLSPWLVGAYVSPDPRRQAELDALSYRDTAWYAGAGVVANLIAAGVCTGAAFLLWGRWVPALCALLVAAAVAVYRRWVAAFVVPAIGVAVLPWLLYLQVTAMLDRQTGPRAYGEVFVVSDAGTALVVAGAVSLLLGVCNAAPIFPLDGGKIVVKLIRDRFGRRAGTAVEAVGAVVLAALLASIVIGSIPR